MVNDLVAQSERAQKIVRNLLDFARESEIESEAHRCSGSGRGHPPACDQPDQAGEGQGEGRPGSQPASRLRRPPAAGAGVPQHRAERAGRHARGRDAEHCLQHHEGSGLVSVGVRRYGHRDPRTEHLRRLRSVLHHQARCQGNRSRALRLLGDHSGNTAETSGEERSRERHHLHGTAPGREGARRNRR